MLTAFKYRQRVRSKLPVKRDFYVYEAVLRQATSIGKESK